MNHVLGVTKKAIADTLLVLENSLSTGPKRYVASSWYENRASELSPARNVTPINLGENSQPDWQNIDRVAYSGVSVLARAKVVMFESLDGYHHPQARKAMVCTERYRPFKYPNSRGVDYTFKFMTHFIKTLKKRKKGTVSGSVALLGNRVSDNANYYHFWVDVIADIWFIKCNVPDSEAPDYYLVPFAGLEWQWDILTMCGLSKREVIPYARYDVLSVQRLVIPIRDKGVANLPNWLSHAIHDMSGWTRKVEQAQRLIFVSRADAGRRRAANEAVIRERLVSEGFEVHTLDGLSIKEQQHLFSSASIVCAPHGAALTNLVWCRPGTVIIDFLSENHLAPCFKELSDQNGVIYYPYICQQKEGKEAGIRGDILISAQQVESVLEIVSRHLPPHTPANDPPLTATSDRS